jgi:hypothetical protein
MDEDYINLIKKTEKKLKKISSEKRIINKQLKEIYSKEKLFNQKI